MTGWRCRRLAALLVDRAEGTAAAAAGAELDQHLTTCADCRERLAALRELPPRLRALAVPERDEAFWRAQRQSILRASRRLAPAERPWAWRPLWRGVAAAVAAAAVLVLVRQAPVPSGSTAILEDADLIELDEIWLGGPALLASPSLDGMEGSADGTTELDDQELIRLEEMIG